jgi:hypothetical protein
VPTLRPCSGSAARIELFEAIGERRRDAPQDNMN